MAIERLTDLDMVMLGASKTWPQDIGALLIFEGAPLLDESGRLRVDPIRHTIEARLHLVPRLRQVIYSPGRGLGGPLWVDDPSFDLKEHLTQRRVDPPGGDEELTRAIEQLRSEPLDPSRPLWDMCLLTGVADERVGVLVRLHHTIADGMAAMASVASLLDSAASSPIEVPLPWVARPAPEDRDLRSDVDRRRVATLRGWFAHLTRPRTTFHNVHRAWPAVRELLAEEPADETSLDRMVGANRKLALIRTDLGAVKAIAHDVGATVNDVLLTITADGLRALLMARGEPVDDTTFRIFVPVSLRKGFDTPSHGNLIAQMVVPLRLTDADPVRRLREISAETKERRAKARTSLGTLMHGRIMRRIALALVMRQRVNATSANIPGPAEPLYLAGARLLEVFPVIPLIANEPLGVGAISYDGGLYIGITADAEAIPDLDIFAQAAAAGLQKLIASVRTPPVEMISQESRIR